MAKQGAPSFSQAAIEAFRDTPEFEIWNRGFESLKRKIRDRVSPKDTQPLVRAGAEEDRIFALLALVVCDSKGLSTKLMARRESLGVLARDLEAVTNRAERSIQDPLCDGRFWLALGGVVVGPGTAAGQYRSSRARSYAESRSVGPRPGEPYG